MLTPRGFHHFNHNGKTLKIPYYSLNDLTQSSLRFRSNNELFAYELKTPTNSSYLRFRSSGNVKGIGVDIVSAPQTPPGVVTNLYVSSISRTTVSLSWLPSTGATSYDIYKDGVMIGSTSSSSYTVSSLTENTSYLFEIIAKNNYGSSVSVSMSVKTPKSEQGAIFELNFSNMKNTVSNAIYDKVNNTPCTLVGVNHSGQDGWISEKGLTLSPEAYINVNSTFEPFSNALIGCNESGITIEFAATEVKGDIFRNESTSSYMYMSNIANTNIRYINTSGAEKLLSPSTSAWIVDGDVTKAGEDIHNGNQELNVYVLRLHPDGKSDLWFNGRKSATNVSVPTDFSKWNFSSLTTGKLYIRRNLYNLNSASTTIQSFRIYNRPLSDIEVSERYSYIKSNEPLTTVNIYPNSPLTIPLGSTQALSVKTIPKLYETMINNSFESGNAGFVMVNQTGTLTGIHEGETLVTIQSKFGSQVFNNSVTVKVGETGVAAPISNRTVTGVAINRKPVGDLYVGRSYAAWATTLPFDVYNDNLLIWESSNPSVCTVNEYGVIDAYSAGTSMINVWDSSRQFSDSFMVKVVNYTPITVSESEKYIVNPNDYGIKTDKTDSLATTIGIQNALAYAKSNGYKSIVFPKANYLVVPTTNRPLGTFNIPDQTIVDFSGSRMDIEKSGRTSTGYYLFLMDNIKNSILRNINIYGEADSLASISEGDEGCLSVQVYDAYKCGIENCTFAKSPGFNVGTGVRRQKTGTTGRNIPKIIFEAGSINDVGNVDNSDTLNKFRTNTLIDIASLGDYFMLGYDLGYAGYGYLRSRLYSIYFYDNNQQFLSKQKYNLQFMSYPKPNNAKYCKLVIYQETIPDTQDGDFNALAFLNTQAMPIDCWFTNNVFEDNTSCGLAMCGGESWRIEGNTFRRNGKRAPACDIDWEDGWDMMVGDIVKNNYFNSKTGVTAAAGQRLIWTNNTFNNSNITTWGRTQNWAAYNNTFNGFGTTKKYSLSCQAESYFERNIISGATLETSVNHSGASYSVHTGNNTII
ncbi:hypothetical protein F4V43_02620 [Paenibacillus spiritus]|uniref:Fibronectin type-III domain-containing protein n=1 Tax=Paenibacillus spiritus TaxID=2496557 RepID=A0A5J5GGR4_9BACL|nr:hypothetical protein [Paenibacillus spiritus]KAA9007399.1 hypothetical protein F4V43_02620 [Paenibacillus spiritus]